MITRRQFAVGASALAFSGLAACTLGKNRNKAVAGEAMKIAQGYGPLIPDPKKVLDLPAGFSYEVVSSFGDLMDDGLHVPDYADGMGCFALPDDRVALVRNHELHPKNIKKQPESIQQHKTELAFDHYENGVALPGGTTTIVYNLKTRQREKEFRSLVGTSRNCAGGTTPWGSWLTCEESVDTFISDSSKQHGYIFEVPATATGLIEPKPLKAMGRFNHEAAVVDPRTGIVYLTEDRGDSLFYRFIPNEYGKLEKGGQLQALVIKQKPQFDTRNWDVADMSVGKWLDTEWINLDNPEAPEDDLRKRGYANGAALFARGEGVHWGDNELYFCCTNGGKKQLGQIMRYQPSAHEGSSHKEQQTSGRLQLFLESADESLYNFGDNLVVTPFGHLIVCEDQYTDVVHNHLRGVSPKGEVYNFAYLRQQTELAGACFSPDGEVMFVNIFNPSMTVAIRGPWQSVSV